MAFVNYAGVTLAEVSSSGAVLRGTSAGGERIVGTSASENISGMGGGDTLVGGGGNDFYYLMSGKDVFVEAAGGGVDQITSWESYVLPANIENLNVKEGDAYAGGNELDNLIIGGAGAQQIYGGQGQDVLVSEGTDLFIVKKGEGNDVVYGFDATDTIRLSGTNLYTFADVKAAMTQVGSDVKLSLGGTDAVVFRDTTIGAFSEKNFALGVDVSKLTQTFNEDFNSLSLWNNDGGRWRADTSYGPLTGIDAHTLRGNNEAEIYTSPFFKGTDGNLTSNPFSVNNGVLTIHAAPASATQQNSIWGYDYTSGWLSTQQSFAQTYGYFEIRAQTPDVQGMWPAFWLVRQDGTWPPEMDVMETIGSEPFRSYSTTHSNATGTHTADSEWDFRAPTSDGFHTWGLLWTDKTITYYLDGAAVHTMATPADMNQPMYMIVNMAVGGDWAGLPNASFTGADYKIDYVRAYSLTPSGTTGAAPQEPTTPPATTQPAPAPGVTLNGGRSDDNLVGGAGADTISGGKGADTITGAAGDDRLDGGAGDDDFVFRPGFGHDVVTGYTAAGNNDQLQFIGFGQTRADSITQVGNDVSIHFASGDSVLVVGQSLSSFTSQDIVYS